MKGKHQPLLTIAIPTFNRSMILNEALKKLLPQINEFNGEIELVISDNASTDNTLEIIDNNLNLFSNINFLLYKQNKNTGYFGNFKKCRDLSNGRYFWLLSDNEHIRDGCINFIFTHIIKNTDFGILYLFNDNRGDFSLKEYNIRSFFSKENSYLITLISAVVMINDKSKDDYIYGKYANNLFLGFLFVINSLINKDKIIQMSGKIFQSHPSKVYFDVFSAFCKDINECLDYMEENTIITLSNKKVFTEGFLKNIVYPYLLNFLLSNYQTIRVYQSKEELKKYLDSYYSSNYYYKRYLRILFKLPRFLLMLQYFAYKIKNKTKNYLK